MATRRTRRCDRSTCLACWRVLARRRMTARQARPRRVDSARDMVATAARARVGRCRLPRRGSSRGRPTAEAPADAAWSDLLRYADQAGVRALPLVLLLGYLMGLILAFQSAVPMRRFGADIFVANLVAISLLRELGPLLAAVILAGRTGSAFAAEIGTMKVNEEIDALIDHGARSDDHAGAATYDRGDAGDAGPDADAWTWRACSAWRR